jgi:nucleoid-associated protein YgaU
MLEAMKFVNAYIVREKAGGTEKEIRVLFNPTKYSLERSSTMSEVKPLRDQTPLPQHVHGDARRLTLDLFFDTYGQSGPDGKPLSVAGMTGEVYELLDRNPEKARPWVCTFVWGEFNFRCMVERVGGSYTLFLPDGTPVRATLSVSFREYLGQDVEARTFPAARMDHARTHTVVARDTLPAVSAAYYGDPALWRQVAQANGIDNPLRLVPGGRLTVPPLA